MFAVLASLPAPAQNPEVAPGGIARAAGGRAVSSVAAEVPPVFRRRLTRDGVAGRAPDLTGPPALLVREGVGPPAIELGPLLDTTHQPRTGPPGWRHASGRVIVKFRDGTSSASRLASLRTSSSRTATISTQPESADFDIVTIGPNEDVEAVAASFRGQAGVEYAQAAYVNHAMFVPNDPLYTQLQWNFPLIDLERAWDIQPQAGSTSRSPCSTPAWPIPTPLST